MTYKDLTFFHAQTKQPWPVTYSPEVMEARDISVHHILGSHTVLHAAKSVGKLAAVFERLDHDPSPQVPPVEYEIADMAADLVTAALRLANLYNFDLDVSLVRRVEEKTGVNILEVS